MADTQFDMPGVPRELTSQTVFQHGLVSPSPLDDMLFASHSDFHFGGGDDATLEQSMKGVLGNDMALNTRTQASASSKNSPPTPTSLSQPTAFVADDSESAELFSILDRPRKTAVKAKHSSADLEGEGRRKKQRRDSTSDTGSVKLEGKDRNREKNKIAAAKCRAKKRDNMEVIESSHRTLSAENSLLRRQEQQLRATVAELRTLALDHQSCSCGVHQYNMLEARKLAQGLGGLCSMGASNNTAPERRRKHSDPVVHASPSAVPVHNRSHSFAAPGHFDMPSGEDFFLQNSVFGAEQSFFEYDPSLHEHKLDA